MNAAFGVRLARAFFAVRFFVALFRFAAPFFAPPLLDAFFAPFFLVAMR